MYTILDVQHKNKGAQEHKKYIKTHNNEHSSKRIYGIGEKL